MEWEKEWEKFLPTVVGHGDGIIGDVRPFIRKLLSKACLEERERILGIVDGMAKEFKKQDWFMGDYDFNEGDLKTSYNSALSDIKQKIKLIEEE